MANLESQFQAKVKRRIRDLLPGAVIMKNDPNDIQGVPDLIVLHKDKWAALECKRSEKAHRQPNQEYYVDKFNRMSFARFIFPENENQVIGEMFEYLNGADDPWEVK